MKRLIKNILITVALVLMVGVSPAFAGSGAKVEVYARVMPMVSVQVVNQPSVLNITPSDIEKGYVEVPAATVLTVKTNSAYVIYFERVAEDRLFEEIEVDTGTATTSIVTSQGMVYEPYPGSVHPSRKTISYRFYLAESVEPGVYPWPVQVGVEAN